MLVYGRTERALDSDIAKFMLRYAPFPFSDLIRKVSAGIVQ